MFSPKDPRKTDYISLNIQESATFARGTSRSLWRVSLRAVCRYVSFNFCLFETENNHVYISNDISEQKSLLLSSNGTSCQGFKEISFTS